MSARPPFRLAGRQTPIPSHSPLLCRGCARGRGLRGDSRGPGSRGWPTTKCWRSSNGRHPSSSIELLSLELGVAAGCSRADGEAQAAREASIVDRPTGRCRALAKHGCPAGRHDTTEAPPCALSSHLTPRPPRQPMSAPRRRPAAGATVSRRIKWVACWIFFLIVG